MSDVFFWNNWHRSYKYTYLIFLSIFGGAVCFFLFCFIFGSEWAYHWELIKTYKGIEVPLATLEMIFFQVVVPAEQYIVTETFKGSNVEMLPWAYILLAVTISFFLGVFLSIITALSRGWYYAGIAIVALILLGLRLEQIILFERTENLGLVLAFLLYFPLSYVFFSLKTSVPFVKRVLAFAIVTLLIGVILSFFSSVPSALVYIGTYGSLVGIGLTIIFVLIVAHDIISLFLNIITSKNTANSRNSLSHFTALSTIYLAWVLLTYLKYTGNIDWDIIYLNPFILLLLSALAGIWEFKYKNQSLFAFLSFPVVGGILYLTLGAVSFITVGVLTVTANDSLLELLEDAILFSHLGIGFMFVIYTFANFAGVLSKNLKVYNVIYKPQNLPYFTATIGGIILVGVLLSRSNLAPIYQGLSGYYVTIGDAHFIDKQLFLGEQYYKLGRSYQFQGHRSNYSLASMARVQGDDALALKYFDDALKKNPSEYAFINRAFIYEKKGRFFDALFSLKEGLDRFPESAYLKNNMGVLFSKTRVLDSALVYLEQANNGNDVEKHASVNIVRVLADLKYGVDYDSIRNSIDENTYLPLVNNKLILLNLQQKQVDTSLIAALNVDRSALSAEEFTFWHSYALNQLDASGTTLISQLATMVDDSTNTKFQPELMLSLAIAQYYNYKVGEAFHTLENLTNISSSREGDYYYLLGLWAFEQRAYDVAVEYLAKAERAGFKNTTYPMAVALTLSGDANSAISYWDELEREGVTAQQKVASLIKSELSTPTSSGNSVSDSVRFVNIFLETAENAGDLSAEIEKIEDEYLRTLANLEIADKLINVRLYTEASLALDKIEGNYLNANQARRLFQIKLHYLAATRQFKAASDFVNNNSHLKFTDLPEYVYFKAEEALYKQEFSLAEENFKKLSSLNPFFEQGIIASARFYDSHNKQADKAYSILLEALKINTYSAILQKAYILQSLHMQLISYAERSLEDLKAIETPEAYQQFLTLYNQQKDSLEQVQDSW